MAKTVRIFAALSIFCALLAAATARAEIQVLFLEMANYQGKPIVLEPGGRFAHLAISYEDKWVHAHPLRGVESIALEDLMKIGRVRGTVLVRLSEHEPLSPEQVEPFLGRPYDHDFSWSDEKLYCSELVAKLLGLAPRPMRFVYPLWPREYQRLNGKPGISPDAVFSRIGGGR